MNTETLDLGGMTKTYKKLSEDAARCVSTYSLTWPTASKSLDHGLGASIRKQERNLMGIAIPHLKEESSFVACVDEIRLENITARASERGIPALSDLQRLVINRDLEQRNSSAFTNSREP